MANTVSGKKTSSRNALKHGLRSKMILIQGETQAEYDAVCAEWWKLYAPRDYREERLVDQLIVNDWFAQRACRVLMEAEAQGDWERIPLIQRYKTAAERAFYRAYHAVEGLRKELEKEGEKEQKKTEKAPRKIRIAEQWVEVAVNAEGKTEVLAVPTSEELKAQVAKLDPERDLVYRRFHFPDGIPQEYLWTVEGEDADLVKYGGAGIQRVQPETWWALIEEEKKAGVFLPCFNMPQPLERGGCECASCREGRRVLGE